MAQPVKHSKSGIYQLRRKVPEDLRPALGHEYKRSLKTTDAAEAKVRYAEAWIESEEAFALARAQAGGEAILSQRDAEQIAARWFKAERDRLERSGRFYDSKPIVAVAYGLQHSSEGPLTNRDLNGGQGSTLAALRRLGFNDIASLGPRPVVLAENERYAATEYGLEGRNRRALSVSKPVPQPHSARRPFCLLPGFPSH